MSDMTSTGRSESDILGRAGIPIVLGGKTHYPIPRTIARNRAWKDHVQRSLASRFAALDGLDGIDEFYAYLSDSVEVLVDLVVGYDESGTVPGRDWVEENASDHEVLEAFMVLLEHAFPFFEMGRRFLPSEVRGIVLTRLIAAVLTSGSRPSTSTPSQPGASTIRPRSRRS